MDNLEEIKKQITKVLNEQIEKTNNELKNLANKLANEFEKQLEKMKSEEEKNGKRWRANINDTYYYINDCGCVNVSHENNDEFDNYRYKMRNYFKTDEEAEEYKEIMTTYYDLMDLAEELNNGEKIDWHNEYQCKFPIYYSFKCDTLDEGRAYVCKELGQIYCLDDNFKKKAVEKIGVDKLTKLFTYERS